MPENPLYRNPNNNNLASFTELNIAKEIIVNTFSNQISSILVEEERNQVYRFFVDYFFSRKIYAIFNKQVLSELSIDVFSNDYVRNFILNLTDRVSILLSVNDFQIEKIAASIAFGISRTKPKENSLIFEKIMMSLESDEDFIYVTLVNNNWLLVLIILYLFSNDTAVFQGIVNIPESTAPK